MATFQGANICDTYKSILNIGPANTTLTTSRVNVTDSAGTASSIDIGQQGQGICVHGNVLTSASVNAGGCICTGGSLQSLGATILGAATISGATCSCGDLTVHTNNLTVGSTKLRVTSTDLCTSNNTTIDGTLTVCGNTAVTGQITASEDIIAYSSSDKKFKDNLNKICNTKNIVNGLNGYSFDWNEQSGREGKDLGLIAQDVKEVLPEIVHTRDDGSLAVDYPKIIPVLIEEVKRLGKEIEELKKA